MPSDEWIGVYDLLDEESQCVSVKLVGKCAQDDGWECWGPTDARHIPLTARAKIGEEHSPY